MVPQMYFKRIQALIEYTNGQFGTIAPVKDIFDFLYEKSDFEGIKAVHIGEVEELQRIRQNKVSTEALCDRLDELERELATLKPKGIVKRKEDEEPIATRRTYPVSPERPSSPVNTTSVSMDRPNYHHTQNGTPVRSYGNATAPAPAPVHNTTIINNGGNSGNNNGGDFVTGMMAGALLDNALSSNHHHDREVVVEREYVPVREVEVRETETSRSTWDTPKEESKSSSWDDHSSSNSSSWDNSSSSDSSSSWGDSSSSDSSGGGDW